MFANHQHSEELGQEVEDVAGWEPLVAASVAEWLQEGLVHTKKEIAALILFLGERGLHVLETKDAET